VEASGEGGEVSTWQCPDCGSIGTPYVAEIDALRARVAELEAENASLRQIPCWVESEDGNPGWGKTADAVEMLGKAYARIEKLEELLSNIVLNAILTPDPSMGGAMDGYMVPIDDIEDARRAITRV
jgi:hypothetical protein